LGLEGEWKSKSKTEIPVKRRILMKYLVSGSDGPGFAAPVMMARLKESKK
jgi:hypothetical protein